MALRMRAAIAILIGFVLAAFFGVSSVFAQSSNAQLVVTTRTDTGTSLPSNATVTVAGTGPSLSGTPGSSGVLTYTTGWNNDSRVVTMMAGNYSAVVSGVSGYLYTYSPECSGFISTGQVRTCVVTASVAALPRVTVFTQVINNNGGTRFPTEFAFTVAASNPSPAFFYGSASGITVSMSPGSYAVNAASAFPEYDVTRSDGCTGILAAGESRTCTITVDDRGSAILPPPSSTLQCHPPRQAVRVGQSVAFTATGGAGTYNWATADRTYLNVGPALTTVLQTGGTQTVIVTSGSQTATCVVDVVAGKVLGTSTGVPYLPNTGFAPSSAGFFAGLAAVIMLGVPLLLYGRRTFAFIWR